MYELVTTAPYLLFSHSSTRDLNILYLWFPFSLPFRVSVLHRFTSFEWFAELSGQLNAILNKLITHKRNNVHIEWLFEIKTALTTLPAHRKRIRYWKIKLNSPRFIATGRGSSSFLFFFFITSALLKIVEINNVARAPNVYFNAVILPRIYYERVTHRCLLNKFT